MNAAEMNDTEFAEHRASGVAASSAGSVSMPGHQERADPLLDMPVDGPIGHQFGAMAEVLRPAAQQSIELVAYIGPWSLVPGCQDLADLSLDPSDTFPRRTGAEIPMPSFTVVEHPERVAEEVEGLLA